MRILHERGCIRDIKNYVIINLACTGKYIGGSTVVSKVGRWATEGLVSSVGRRAASETKIN